MYELSEWLTVLEVSHRDYGEEEGNNHNKDDCCEHVSFWFAVDSDHLLFSNRSYAYASLNQFAEALNDAEKVVQLRPDWPKGFFRKGSALYGLGQYEDAVIAFLQCLALDKEVSSAKDYLSKVSCKEMFAVQGTDCLLG